MAIGGLLSLFDDITTLLDNIVVTTKVAATKAVGIVSDDLALNAQQVIGVKSDRELPIVWSVAKGSLLNKIIIIPLALMASAFIPWVVPLALLIGGLYLSFEGAEKIIETIFSARDIENNNAKLKETGLIEKDKIKGAIRTDFVLSLEIIIVTLGTITSSSLLVKAATLCLIGLFSTVFVYGLVAVIIRMDDVGAYLIKKSNKGTLINSFGKYLLSLAPCIMKMLSVVGTVAMLAVGGGIICSHLTLLKGILISFVARVESVFPQPISCLGSFMANIAIGLSFGCLMLVTITIMMKMKKSIVSR